MSRPLPLVVTGLVAAALTAGCASDNPREGGFLGGVGGLASGNYEDRVRSRQESLDSLKAARTDIESEQAGLQSRKSASEQQLKAERQKLARLETDTRKLSEKVKTLKADEARQQGQVAELARRTRELEGKVQQAGRPQGADALEGDGSGPQDARRAQLEAQRRQLEEEYRLLTDMYLKLGS
jgi:Skp family chaperone for outer membrane proteins